MKKIPTGIDWLGVNRNILHKAAIFTINIIMKKLNGENTALVQSLKDFLNHRLDEIQFPDNEKYNLSSNVIHGLLHERGTFRNIGFDARYEIKWRNMNRDEAMKELNTLKSQFISLIKRPKDIDSTIEKAKEKVIDSILDSTKEKKMEDLGLDILRFLKKEMKIFNINKNQRII